MFRALHRNRLSQIRAEHFEKLSVLCDLGPSASEFFGAARDCRRSPYISQ